MDGPFFIGENMIDEEKWRDEMSIEYDDYIENQTDESIPKEPIDPWQGPLLDRYNCYLEFANDGTGFDKHTGYKLKIFSEWLNS